MRKEKDIFELIKQYPEQTETNDAVLQEAKSLARKRYGRQAQLRRRRWMMRFVSVAVSCVLVFAIVLPISLLFSHNQMTELPNDPSGSVEPQPEPQPEPEPEPEPEPPSDGIFFLTEDLTVSPVSDTERLQAENGLSFAYFTEGALQTSAEAYYVSEDGSYAYFMQYSFFTDEFGFDTVNLGVVSSNNTFEAFDAYAGLTEELWVDDLHVLYSVSYADSMAQIRCTFQENGNHYFLEIRGAGTEGVIEKYVTLLFS